MDAAPINIVSNPAASDPTVRNGLSCIGCHTEGMKDFEDQVRGVVMKRTRNPPFDKDRALRLYTEQAMMDALLDEDTRSLPGRHLKPLGVSLVVLNRFSVSTWCFRGPWIWHMLPPLSG